MKDVAGKTAFVTGGASGVGLGMATVFARAGMNVVAADVREDHIEHARGGIAEAVKRRNSLSPKPSQNEPVPISGFEQAWR